MSLSKEELSFLIEKEYEWRKWQIEIPYIKWPHDWEVKAVPPFLGAIIRYNIKTPQCQFISVYLDCYDMIGFVGSPYWEVYPYKGDCFRCAMNDTEALLKAIGECRDGN